LKISVVVAGFASILLFGNLATGAGVGGYVTAIVYNENSNDDNDNSDDNDDNDDTITTAVKC